MRSTRKLWPAGACLAGVLLLASCHAGGVHHVHHWGPRPVYGPPVHAQAHGYRRKRLYGYDLVYDSGCRMYVVVGMSDCYYHEGHFYRLHGDVWHMSVRPDADWRPVGHGMLPAGLKAKSIAKVNGNGNSLVKTNGNSPVKTNGNSPVKTNGNGNSPVKTNGNGNSPVKTNGNGNSIVKTNGNGNSVVKTNGNSSIKSKGNGKGRGRGR